MTAINQGTNSVHYTGTEAVSRRTFIGPRYEVPLFLCKRLSVPAERSDNVEQEVLRNGRQNLLQGMTNYGQQPNWKGDRFPTGPGSSRQQQPGEEVYYEQIPREMDKLAQPRRYFVGKIRPGDKSTERPCSRLALSTATLCWRNPADPGPDRYFKGIFDIAAKVATASADPLRPPLAPPPLPPPTANRHSYCAEPFRRPPPGRYDLRRECSVLLNAPPPPTCRGQSHRRRRRRPLEMTLNANWKPFRQQATLRMHTVDIPRRRRKRGRNMKVAFGSSTARFKDQDFFPIGALQSTIPGQHQQQQQQRRRSRRKSSQSGPAANLNQNRASSNFDADDDEEPPPMVQLATLEGTRTKQFIVPRRRQTVATLDRLMQIPLPSEAERVGPRMMTSRVKIELPEDDDDGEGGPGMKKEVFDDGGTVGDKADVETEIFDEKSKPSD